MPLMACVSIQISKPLYEKLKETAKEENFKNADEYAAFIIRKYLSENALSKTED